MVSWLEAKTHYTAFIEGWALYAENPLTSDDTDVYDNEPMQKYGMLKGQVSRVYMIKNLRKRFWNFYELFSRFIR